MQTINSCEWFIASSLHRLAFVRTCFSIKKPTRTLPDIDHISFAPVQRAQFQEVMAANRAHKNKIGTLPPQNTPLKRGILWTWRFSCRKNTDILGAHKICAAISCPRIADNNFMDTRIYLIVTRIRITKVRLLPETP